MSCDIYESRRVKTRKNHYCGYCGALIPKGTESVLFAHTLVERDWSSTYCCSACEPYINGFWESLDGREMYANQMIDYFTDYLEEVQHEQ